MKHKDYRQYSESYIDYLRQQIESIMDEVAKVADQLEQEESIPDEKWEKAYDQKFLKIQVHLNDLLEDIY